MASYGIVSAAILGAVGGVITSTAYCTNSSAVTTTRRPNGGERLHLF